MHAILKVPICNSVDIIMIELIFIHIFKCDVKHYKHKDIDSTIYIEMKNNVNLDCKFESTLQNMLFIITMIKLLFRLSTFSQKKNGKNFYIKLIFLVLIIFVFVRSMTHCCEDEYKNIMVFIMCILKVSYSNSNL